jgi:hypothetical protein
MKLHEVAIYLRVHRSTLYRCSREVRFPPSKWAAIGASTVKPSTNGDIRRMAKLCFVNQFNKKNPRSSSVCLSAAAAAAAL